jgi:hypothetical protein
MRPRSIAAITWTLIAVAGATAVGITTQRPSFVVITLLGSLWLPRALGLRGWGRRPWHGWHGHHHGDERKVPARIEERLDAWHRQAHEKSGAGPASSGNVSA